jgi:hypothetical protein
LILRQEFAHGLYFSKTTISYRNAQDANETFYSPETSCEEETHTECERTKPFFEELKKEETTNPGYVANITIRSPAVDLSGLSSRSRVMVIRQIVQKVGEMRQQIERKENGPKRRKVDVSVTVTYKFGEKDYSVKHKPTELQNGNVYLPFIDKIDRVRNSIRQKMNLLTKDDENGKSSEIAKIIRQCRNTGIAIKLPNGFVDDESKHLGQ